MMATSWFIPLGCLPIIIRHDALCAEYLLLLHFRWADDDRYAAGNTLAQLFAAKDTLFLALYWFWRWWRRHKPFPLIKFPLSPWHTPNACHAMAMFLFEKYFATAARFDAAQHMPSCQRHCHSLCHISCVKRDDSFGFQNYRWTLWRIRLLVYRADDDYLLDANTSNKQLMNFAPEAWMQRACAAKIGFMIIEDGLMPSAIAKISLCDFTMFHFDWTGFDTAMNAATQLRYSLNRLNTSRRMASFDLFQGFACRAYDWLYWWWC